MIPHGVQLENDEALLKQVDFFTAIQQRFIFATLIKGLQDRKKITEVEILIPDIFLSQDISEILPDEFIKAVERRIGCLGDAERLQIQADSRR